MPLAVLFVLLALLGGAFVVAVRSPRFHRDAEVAAALVVVALIVFAVLWATGVLQPGALHTVRHR